MIVSGALSIWRGYYLYMISPLLSLCAQQASGVCFGCLDVLVCTCYSGYPAAHSLVVAKSLRAQGHFAAVPQAAGWPCCVHAASGSSTRTEVMLLLLKSVS